MQTELSEATRHRADDQIQVVGYLSIVSACSTLLDKAIKQSVRGGMRAEPRSRRTILQAGLTFLSKTLEPLVGRPNAYACSLCGIFDT